MFRKLFRNSFPIICAGLTFFCLTTNALAEPWDVVCRQDAISSRSPAVSLSLVASDTANYSAICVHQDGTKKKVGTLKCTNENHVPTIKDTRINADGMKGNVIHNLVVCGPHPAIAMN